jgi:HEAT repeat protein
VAGVGALVAAFPATVYVPLGLLRHEAFFAGKPTSYWARALKGEGYLGHGPPAGDVGNTLREGGPAAVPVLCQIAASPDGNLRSEALLGLRLIGPQARAATPTLEVAIKTETDSARFQLASEALARADPAAATETLSAVVRDEKDVGRRSWALTELLKLAPQCEGALPVLNELLNNPDEDARLRVQAVEVLWHLKQPAGPLVAALCAVANDPKSPAGVQALVALGEMGPAAKPAVPDLVKLLRDPRLATIGQKWGPAHRAAVVRALGHIGPAAAAAVPALLDLLRSNSFFLRSEIVVALTRMGPPAREAVATRDAVWAVSTALLAGRPPTSFAAPPLVQEMKRIWVPRDSESIKDVREAVRRMDPGASAGPGGD